MINTLLRVLTNAIFLVPLQVRRFKAKEPESQIVAVGATKAQKMKSERDVRYEPGWIAARRGVLLLTNDRLMIGRWIIPLSTINNATLLRVKTLFGRALILKVSTDDGNHYQFGLQYNPV